MVFSSITKIYEDPTNSGTHQHSYMKKSYKSRDYKLSNYKSRNYKPRNSRFKTVHQTFKFLLFEIYQEDISFFTSTKRIFLSLPVPIIVSERLTFINHPAENSPSFRFQVQVFMKKPTKVPQNKIGNNITTSYKLTDNLCNIYKTWVSLHGNIPTYLRF